MMDWLKETFEKQVQLQQKVKNVKTDVELPNTIDMYGAATGMIIEIGEMLQCDTRWKKEITHSKKEPVYNYSQFMEEMADVFIYFMNVAIYSGVNIDTLKRFIIKKQDIVKERFNDK